MHNMYIKYKALKNFSTPNNTYKVGDDVLDVDVVDRFIRSRKIEKVRETKNTKRVEQDENTEKAKKDEKTQEMKEDETLENADDIILTDVSSNVDIVVEELSLSEKIKGLKSKDELEELGREIGFEVDKRKSLKNIKKDLEKFIS